MTLQLYKISPEGEPGSLKDWYINSQHIQVFYAKNILQTRKPGQPLPEAKGERIKKDPKMNEILLLSRLSVVIFFNLFSTHY